MSNQNLDKIFAPASVAVIGASDDETRVGYHVFANLLNDGFKGPVYPVNRKRGEVQGRSCYRSMADLPEAVDLAVICIPAKGVPGVVRECGESGVRGVVVISAGFRETGEAGRELEGELRQVIHEFEGLRVVGPNCVGIVIPRTGLNASFGLSMPKPGSLAFVSQSGALCTAVGDWAVGEGVGFAYFVSLGNMIDVDYGDLTDYFGQVPETSAILLYIESVQNARKFMSAARAFTKDKPVMAFKSGRYPMSAQAASSHTGAMAGRDAVYDAVFKRAGIVRVDAISDFVDAAEILARAPARTGGRLAIVTNAGGPGVVATDALAAGGGHLAELGTETREALDGILPSQWSGGNPVDILGDASESRYRKTLDIVLGDERVDGVLVILSPQAMTDPAAVAAEVADVAGASTKPIVTCWFGGPSVAEGIARLNAAGIATFSTPEPAVRAYLSLVAYAQGIERIYETPHRIEIPEVDHEAVSAVLTAPERTTPWLTEAETKDVLTAYGIPASETRVARSRDEAVAAARDIGFPVAVKVHSTRVVHKSDVGGVRLDLRDEQQVREAYDGILERVVEAYGPPRPAVSVQPMVSREGGVELILGASRDPTFGAVIMVGYGGVAAEVFQDSVLELPPVNEVQARRMIDSLRCRELLYGHRGSKPLAVERLVETIVRFSRLVVDQARLPEVEMNPLLVTENDVMALDARARIVETSAQTREHDHLAIRPYPREYVKDAHLRDGTAVRLRPIRAEDEPLWKEMIASCSSTTIRARFLASFRHTTHEMATRYCMIDYDREMALVAEAHSAQGPKLLGVGRYVILSDAPRAEFAVLVADPWQGRGLGHLLMSECITVARDQGIKRLEATCTLDNSRMLALFRRHGFDLQQDYHSRIVRGVLTL